MDTPTTLTNPPRGTAAGRLGCLLLVLVLLAGAGWLWWKRPFADSQSMGPGGPGGAGGGRSGMRGGPVPVTVAQVKREDMEEWITLPATATPLQVVVVRSRIDGELQRVHFEEGQMVKAGDLLAEIDPRPFQVALDQAEAQLARDEAMLANAKLVLERYQVLLKQNSIARQEVDTQESLVRQHEAGLAADRAAVASAELQLSYTRITAPIGGRTGLRRVDAGNMIRSTDSTGLVVLTQEDPMGLVFSIPQDRVSAVRQRLGSGQPVTVRVVDADMKGELGVGRLLSTENQIDLVSGTLKLKAGIPNQGRALFPNQFVIAKLLVNTVSGAVVAPAGAIQQGAQGPYAFLVNAEGGVSLRQVVTGITQGDRVMVVDGLSPGETVATQGLDRLRDGATVQVVDGGGKSVSGGGSGPGGGGGAARGGPGRAETGGK